MKPIEQVTVAELRDLLGKGWLTHDGAWFLNVAGECGVEAANRLNKAAIKTMAPLEMMRARKLLAPDAGELDDFRSLFRFAVSALLLILPGSVAGRFRVESPRDGVFAWEWEKGQCFAYRGMRQFGLVDGYECGVIFRLECWLDALGLHHQVRPRIDGCLMHRTGSCSGEIILEAC